MTTRAQNGLSHGKGVICLVEVISAPVPSCSPKSVTQCLVLPVQEVAFLDELRSFEQLGRAVSLCT